MPGAGVTNTLPKAKARLSLEQIAPRPFVEYIFVSLSLWSAEYDPGPGSSFCDSWLMGMRGRLSQMTRAGGGVRLCLHEAVSSVSKTVALLVSGEESRLELRWD